MGGNMEGLVDPFAVGDLLYRIDTYGLSAGLNDGDFRSNVQPILEDVRVLLSGVGYSLPPLVVTDEMVERIEQAVGMSAHGWDMVDPKELIRAALATQHGER